MFTSYRVIGQLSYLLLFKWCSVMECGIACAFRVNNIYIKPHMYLKLTVTTMGTESEYPVF